MTERQTPGTDLRLDDAVELALEDSWAPGLALAVTDRDGVVLDRGFGLADLAAQQPVTPSTLFEIGSISKGFTAALLLQARDSGLVDLDAPVATYLPWFEVRSRFRPITVRHLLTHTAGIVRGAEYTSDAAFEVWALRETEATVAPGTWHYYSNTGYKALGLVVQAVYGRPYEDVLADHLLAPLAMSSSEAAITHDTRRRLAVGYEPFYDDRPARRSDGVAPATWVETATADGSIASTAADMTAWLRLLLRDGSGPDGKPVLRTESVREMLTGAVLIGEPGEHLDRPAEYYGLGMEVYEVEGRRMVSHTGGMVGYHAAVVCDLDRGLGAVVLANGEGPWDQVARHAVASTDACRKGSPAPTLAVPEDDDPPPASDTELSEPPVDLAPFIGHYRCWNPWMSNIRVQFSAGRLWVWNGESSALGQPLVPLPEGHFRVGRDERGPERVRFDVVLDGKAVRATVSGCAFYRSFTP